MDEARKLLERLTKVAAVPLSQASLAEQETELSHAEDALRIPPNSGGGEGRLRGLQAELPPHVGF